MTTYDIFDFDKTLYKKDSSIEFYFFILSKNIKIIKYLPFQIISFVKYKFRIISKVQFKEAFFSYLNSLDNTDDYIDMFWKKNRKYIREELLKNSNNPIIIISASPEFLLKNISKTIKANKLIASKVDINTGKWLSKNCYGEEKVNRLNREVENCKIENFYTDSKSDKPLALLSKNSYIIKNNKVLEWRVKK